MGLLLLLFVDRLESFDRDSQATLPLLLYSIDEKPEVELEGEKTNEHEDGDSVLMNELPGCNADAATRLIDARGKKTPPTEETSILTAHNEEEEEEEEETVAAAEETETGDVVGELKKQVEHADFVQSVVMLVTMDKFKQLYEHMQHLTEHHRHNSHELARLTRVAKRHEKKLGTDRKVIMLITTMMFVMTAAFLVQLLLHLVPE